MGDGYAHDTHLGATKHQHLASHHRGDAGIICSHGKRPLGLKLNLIGIQSFPLFRCHLAWLFFPRMCRERFFVNYKERMELRSSYKKVSWTK